jgi:two-component system, chemotaxis family, chemotaxis protein CheY
LIVEDDPDALAIIVDRLHWEGYEVVTATNGADAWTFLQAGYRPAVVILDVMMPGVDGVALRKMMLKSRATSEIPVIVVTAMGGLTRTVMPNVAAFFSKPVPLEELVDSVARYAAPTRTGSISSVDAFEAVGPVENGADSHKAAEAE